MIIVLTDHSNAHWMSSSATVAISHQTFQKSENKVPGWIERSYEPSIRRQSVYCQVCTVKNKVIYMTEPLNSKTLLLWRQYLLETTDDKITTRKQWNNGSQVNSIPVGPLKLELPGLNQDSCNLRRKCATTNVFNAS